MHRDEEFSAEVRRLSRRLGQYFYSRLGNEIAPADKAVLKDDLVQLTALSTLKLSRKRKNDKYAIETLLFLQARHVWYRHTHPPKKHQFIDEPDEMHLLKSREPDACSMVVSDQNLQDLQSQTDPLTWQVVMLKEKGYQYDEISKRLGLSTAAIKMRIKRLWTQITAKRNSFNPSSKNQK